MKKFVMLACAALIMAAPTMVHAEGDRADYEALAPKSGWKKMTEEQRAAKKAEMKGQWEAMTPEQRAALKEKRKQAQKERYQKAAPEQKAKMKEKHDRIKGQHEERKSHRQASPAAPQ